MKKDLRIATALNAFSIVKLVNNQNISTDTLIRVCKSLNFDISDIMEIVKEISDKRRLSLWV
ncbi:MAG: helix-turn-helix transcriptional regulator [Clostridia bacterium]|nr:helix-turn-helix transcriptional regulator [Clostridia bacterium]